MKHHQAKRKRIVQQDTSQKEEDLDRFAGSSDEESKDVSASSDDNCGEKGCYTGQSRQYRGNSNEKETLEADVESDSEGSSEDDSNDQVPQKLGFFHAASSSRATNSPRDDRDDNDPDAKASHSDVDSVEEATGTMASSGMAAAMSRILGTGSVHAFAVAGAPDNKKSPVLSKTKTPLQRQAEKEKKDEREMKERRRMNREKHLQALHIPLSVATTSGVSNDGTSLSKELEQERLLRRVATRGVVALFNAISQHQREGSVDEKQKLQSSSKTGKTAVAKMTKDGFLDLIKSKASQVKEKAKAETRYQEEAPKWTALRDDYMMDSKKNWDEDDGVDSKWTDDENDDSDSNHSDEKDSSKVIGKKPKVR